MLDFKPFRALTFDPAGDWSKNLAPHIEHVGDVNSVELKARSEQNIAWLTDPERDRSDRSKFVRFARSSSRLMEWANSGVLSKAPESTYYKLTAELNGESVSWMIGLLNLRSEPKVSVPFRIPPVVSEERARLLEAAYAYTDLVELVSRSEPSVVILSSELLGQGERDGVQWTLEAVSGDFSELPTDNDWSVATGASTWIAAQGFSERNGSKRRVGRRIMFQSRSDCHRQRAQKRILSTRFALV
ncbi:MAG: DUF1015 family protein [Fimbriimonadaceae bacterium]